MVFEGFRRSFDELLTRATRPEERRAIASRMKDTLVQARLGLDDLRDGLAKARQRLGERRAGVGDGPATKAARGRHQGPTRRANSRRSTSRCTPSVVEMLRRKVAAQEAEVALAEREVAEMSAELKAVLAGAPMPNHVGGPVSDAELGTRRRSGRVLDAFRDRRAGPPTRPCRSGSGRGAAPRRAETQDGEVADSDPR